MRHDHASTIPGQEPTHHEVPITGYLAVFAILVVLMLATIGAAEFLHLPTLAMNLIAMAIAVLKATLVILYFMGVKYTTQLCKIFAIGGFVWVTLMLIMFCDYGTRHDEPAPDWANAEKFYLTDVNKPELGKEAPRQYFGAH